MDTHVPEYNLQTNMQFHVAFNGYLPKIHKYFRAPQGQALLFKKKIKLSVKVRYLLQILAYYIHFLHKKEFFTFHICTVHI